jgi:AcrR family transcriptional regulator
VTTVVRQHTGRRRNEEARRAVLDATLAILREGGTGALTIDAIARAAGVGRQTVYRWWPSRGAIVLEAARDLAERDVPVPATDSPADDLRTFLRRTFTVAGSADRAPVLRAMMAESLRDEQFAAALREFTEGRRQTLTALIIRLDVAPGRASLLAETAFALLWYRLLMANAPLTEAVADEATDLIRTAAHAG